MFAGYFNERRTKPKEPKVAAPRTPQVNRFNVMVQDLISANTLYNYQQKLAKYKNKREPNYIRAVRESRPAIFMRVLRAYNNVPNSKLTEGVKILENVNQDSSPRELFEALKKMRALNTGPGQGLSILQNGEAVPKLTFTQKAMVKDLVRTRNYDPVLYKKKMLLYQNQKNYAKALIEAKGILANRVREKYETLPNAYKKMVRNSIDINAGRNKNSNINTILKALRYVYQLPLEWRFT